MKKEKLLYFFYNRYNDPLLQANIFLYINRLAKENKYDVAIITYEDARHPISAEEKDRLRKKHELEGIKWYPLKWNAGTNLFLKFIDLSSGFLKVAWLVRSKGYKHVITLGSVAGSFVYLFSKFVKLKHYLYQYEPHSEFELDTHVWTASGKQFKLLNKYEKKSAEACKVVSSGTEHMRQRLTDWKIKGDFFKITSVANEHEFTFSVESRNQIRNEFKIPARAKLIVYPGKLGELYYGAAELLIAFKALKELDEDFYLLVATPNITQVNSILKTEKEMIRNSVTLIPPVDHSKMPAILSAGDLGIVAIPPTPSQKFRSPIKVAEYLMCGLPYLVCEGISEDDMVAKKNNVGIVVKDFSTSEISRAYSSINEMLSQSKELIAERCRKIGIDYRGFENQFKEYKKALDSLVK